MHLNYQLGNSNLSRNGVLPVGLLAPDRDAVVSAPDITKNNMDMLDLEFRHAFTESILLSGNTFKRANRTDSSNGDISEFEACRYAGGDQSLFEEADEVKNALSESHGIDLHEICEGANPGIRNFDELEDLIKSRLW